MWQRSRQMSSEKESSSRGSFFSNFAALALLLLLPVFAIWLLGSAIIAQNSENLRAAGERALDQRAEAISELLEPENFFGLHFRRFYEELYNGEAVTPERVRQLAIEFSARQLGFCPAVFADGKLVTPAELLGEHEVELTDAWEVANKYSRRHTLTSSKYLTRLFGAPYSRMMLFRHEGRIMKFTGYRGDGYIFFQRSPKFAARPEEFPPAGVYIVLWSMPSTTELINFLPNALTTGVHIALRQRAAITRAGDSQLQIVRKKIGEHFLFVSRKFSGFNRTFAQTLLKVFLLFLVMIVAMLAKDGSFFAAMRTASIRSKLIGLILYAVILPLSGLVYFGWKYLAERRELLIQDAWLACQGSINDFDNGFEKDKARMLSLFRSLKEKPDMKADPARLKDKVIRLDLDNVINWLEVRDIDAEVVMTTQRRETAEKIGIIGKAIARLGIHKFLGHRLAGRSQSVKAAEVMVQEFLEGPFGGWARIFESPDELHQVSFGGYEIYWYWDVYNDPGIKAAFIVIDQNVRWAVRNYLAANLIQRVSYGHGAVRLFAWSSVYSELWPGETYSEDELMIFVRQVRRSNGPRNSIIRWNGVDWVAAGAPGKKLVDTVLLSLYPLDEVDREIAIIRSGLIWAVVFALILALLVGSLFSHTIIRPVANLMTGVQALRRRDTSHRLEIWQNDELGRLSATLNATTETLADIISAQAIQAQLIPETAPIIEGFTGDLVYIPAADLGGDYCDFLSLPDGRWLMVIGDVTGHGVSSALVTTMIKAVVTDYAADSNFSLSAMFTCLNELLFSQFRRKKCMTLFAAVINSSTGQIDCINAGHPLPLHFSNDARQQFPQLCRPPLGFSLRNSVFPEATLQMAAGDCLILYTDILIETADSSGKPYGSEGFARLCRKYLHLPPAQMRVGILEEIQSESSGDLDDDLTMIILRRNTATEPV
ncbi:MAG: hypothetical protein CVV42_12115 [Candidatus Riflebacteria bacterium HGW-Riflebacteria-2]|nr:MAG: hypothetical protein CVV42_12115 [Candidatus Riflebacteria bacterium HGW-Riflebacteria-2]